MEDYDVYENLAPSSTNGSGEVLAPRVREWLDSECSTPAAIEEDIPSVYLVFLIICLVLVLLMAVLTWIQLRRIHKFIGNESVQLDMYWITLFPLVGAFTQ